MHPLREGGEAIMFGFYFSSPPILSEALDSPEMKAAKALEDLSATTGHQYPAGWPLGVWEPYTPPKKGDAMIDKPFDFTKPFTTRDGRKARLLASDVLGAYPFVVAVSDGPMHEEINQYDLSGRPSGYNNFLDFLFNIPAKRTVWLVIENANIAPDWPGMIGSIFSAPDLATSYQMEVAREHARIISVEIEE